MLRRDEAIRSRLREGDEDSIVNFLWFGTGFTQHPRMTATHLSTLDEHGPEALLEARLDDLVAGILSPGVNERLQISRALVEGEGIDVADATGASDVKTYLAQINTRTLQDFDRYRQTESISQSAFFSERGLSSDTSILVDFDIDRALDEIASEERLAPGSVRRVAVVGPGLDVFNKEKRVRLLPSTDDSAVCRRRFVEASRTGGHRSPGVHVRCQSSSESPPGGCTPTGPGWQPVSAPRAARHREAVEPRPRRVLVPIR